jgi:PAS domain S-box-containing protein
MHVPHSNKMRSAIAKRLIFYVILVSSFITLVITAIQLYKDYSRELKIIESGLKQVEDVHVESLTFSLWAVDIKNLKTQMKGILRLPNMEYLEITEGNKVWAAVGNHDSGNYIEQVYPLVYVSKGKPRKLGQLRVVASLEGVYDRLIDKAIAILVGNAVKTFLVAGFILWLFYYLVTRHLVTIASFIENHDIDNKQPEKLKLDRPESDSQNKDELDAVVDRLNTMQSNIRTSYEKLRTSEEKYRQLVELSQEGIWTIDKDAVTTFVNPALAHMMGYTVDEMLGKSLFDFMDEEGKAITVRNLEQRQQGIGASHEFELVRKDGSRLYTIIVASPFTDANGNYMGSIAGVLDITQRRQAEEELRLQQEKLEELVRERTKALEISNRELEAFSYSVAHDLRAPLRSIISFGQVLEDVAHEKLDEEGRDALQRMIRAGKNMSELIDDLLELSRISRTSMEKTRVNLGDVAREAIDVLAAAEPGRYSEILIDNDLYAVVDPTLIQVLMQNLIQNAWKFSNRNDVTVIEVGKRALENETCFYVRDNGVGFNMEYAGKVFDAFQRLHRPDEFSGTGIGLATVHRIVQRHGGKVWAESEIGKGATFYFTLEKKAEHGNSQAWSTPGKGHSSSLF